MVKIDVHSLPKDPSSYSNPEAAKTTHFDLDWTVDFTTKTISGSVLLQIDVSDDAVNHFILDSRDLNISKIVCESTGQELNYNVAKHDEKFGSKLSIELPLERNTKKLSIRIFYSTSPSSSALQWLSPSQTAGKKHPYLFSQCQAIQARSLMPCQDTPSVKSTYSASVKCNSDLVVLMSALRDSEVTSEGGVSCYKFHQSVVIPSYLLAIVVGDLVSEDIGPRSKVWSEREIVKKAAYEFAETEEMLSIAESICGPYVWQQYDLLVLPPSFPFGGMENPCLTFVTPTILAGDRSLADVIAHEICHSWTGNLVTNCNWEHFWLNEGFTMFLERKILERMHGKRTRHLNAICGWESLKKEIEHLGKENPVTFLVPNYEGVDPDEAYSTVPYEKGHTFLWYLESLLGGSEEFDPFLKSYIEKYHHQAVDSEIFKAFLLDYFSNKKEELESIDWHTWFKTPGLPNYDPKFDTTLADACTKLCESWKEWVLNTDCSFNKADLKAFSSEQIIVWLDKVLAASIPLEKVKKMDERYHLTSYENAEIKFRWLRVCIKARWLEKADDALEFVNSQGRMKYVRPIHRDLYEWEDVRQKVIANFNATKSAMMYVAVQALTKDLHLAE